MGLAGIFSSAVCRSQVREMRQSDYHVTWCIGQFLSYRDRPPITISRAPLSEKCVDLLYGSGADINLGYRRVDAQANNTL